MARRIRCAVRMQQLTDAEARQEDVRQSSDDVLPLARCRELLGDEAAGVSDEELDRVRRHADALAHVRSRSRRSTFTRLEVCTAAGTCGRSRVGLSCR
jgi:hypothetical protein